MGEDRGTGREEERGGDMGYARGEGETLPFPHTRMLPLESPVMASPFSANVTQMTNLGFSCFWRRQEDKPPADWIGCCLFNSNNPE